MPWSNQSDGNNSGGPWGRGSSGKGPTPPNDFENFLRGLGDRIRRFMPNGEITMGAVALIAAAAVGLWLLTGLYFVSTHEQGVVLRFGRFVALTGPGPNYHLPWPIETVELPEVTTTHQIDIGYQ